MHDYYPIVARAVSRLESNTPRARHELFERIRRVLIDQLRIREPPPTGSDFRRERAALEEAIHRIEVESVTSCLANRAFVDVSSVKHFRDTEGLRRIEHNLAVKGPGRGPPAVDADRASLEPIRTRTSRDQRQQDMLSVRRSKASADAIQQTELECPGLDSHDATTIATSDRGAETTVTATGLNSFAASPNSNYIRCSPLSDLLSIHCLDELLRGGAEPLAPESLKRDSNAILKWLAVQNAETLKPEHYEKFTRAFRANMMEWETPTVRRAIQLSLSLNDDIRAVFDRMLEREQAAVVFDDALTWFASIWIGLMLALNLIVGVILIVAAPTIGTGLGKFAATYSPLNLWCWVCQVFAFSPAVIAIYVKRERMREKDDARGRAEQAVGDARYRQALRPGRGRMERRNVWPRRR